MSGFSLFRGYISRVPVEYPQKPQNYVSEKQTTAYNGTDKKVSLG
jgi:hypothetical protein